MAAGKNRNSVRTNVGAIVFNCHYNGLSITQELGRRGVEVLALDSVRSVGSYSRFARFQHCPDPLVAENAFIDYLMQLGSQFNDKPVLFPTNDHWAMAVSRHKEDLAQFYRPCVADFSVISLLIEKQRFYEWGLSQKLPLPRSWRIVDAAMIPNDAFPLVAKPEYRRIASNDLKMGKYARIFDKLRLTILKTRKDLAEFVGQNEDLLPYLLFQEYVEGLSDCMYTVGIYADRNYEVKGLFTGRKVRGYPPDIGDCIVGQVEEVPNEIKCLVKGICKSIGYHGIAEFEFKRNSVTGQFKLIEINPRSWSWIGITPACGVSLPWMAYADLAGLESIQYTECDLPSGSVKYVKVLEDMKNCFYGNRQLGFQDWDMTISQWRESLQAEKIVCAEFAKDDVMIGVRACYSFMKSIIESLIRSVKKT